MSKAQPATPTQRRRWEKIRELGCMVEDCQRWPVTIHHVGTGGGGRKNHERVIGLCHYHHQGEMGIDRRHFGATEEVFDWEELFGTEQLMIEKVERLLGERNDEAV